MRNRALLCIKNMLVVHGSRKGGDPRGGPASAGVVPEDPSADTCQLLLSLAKGSLYSKSERIYTLRLSKFQGTLCLKQAQCIQNN